MYIYIYTIYIYKYIYIYMSKCNLKYFIKNTTAKDIREFTFENYYMHLGFTKKDLLFAKNSLK